MINQTQLHPAVPYTSRGALKFISYDKSNNRIAYTAGKSIIVTSLDENSNVHPIQFTKHNFTTTVAAFSPSGNYVASGDEAGNVKIWDMSLYGKEATFEQPLVKSEFKVLSGPIRSISWDASNCRIIAAGRGKEKFAHCFTWDSGNSVGEIQGHSQTINAVDIKPQRPYRAATVGDDKAMVFFHGPPFKFNKSVRGHHTNFVRSVRFSSDGKWLVSVGSDRAIVLYDASTGEFINKVENAHDGGIYDVSWFTDLATFVTCSADNLLKKWRVEGLEQVVTFKLPHPKSVENQQVGLAVTKDYVLSLSLNGNLNFFTHNGSFSHTIFGHQSALTQVVLVDNNLITGGSDGLLIKWNAKGGKLDPKSSKFADGSRSNYVTGILPFRNKLVTSGWDDKLKVWNGTALETSIDLPGQPKCILEVSDCLAVLYESKLEVHDTSLQKLGEISFDFVASAADVIAKTNLVLITNETNKRLEEYEVGTLIAHKRSYPELRAAPTLVKVSPDGQYAAVAASTGKYHVYNTGSATVITTRWAFHNSRVNGAAWTPDSKYLVSGGLDCGLFIFSLERPAKVLKTQLTHQTGVSGLAWLAYDGKKGSFASVGLDGMVKTWDVEFSEY